MKFNTDFKQCIIVLGIFTLMTFVEAFFNKNEPIHFKARLQNIFYMIVLILGGDFLIGLLPKLDYDFYKLPIIKNPYLYAFCHLLYIDICFYLYHRAQHHNKYLWKLHRLHHSDPEMNITTSYRTNIFDLLLQHLILVLPALYLFGYNYKGLIYSYYISLGFLFFTHLKLNIGSRIISKLIVTPNLHALHHTHDKKIYGKNFAQFFSFIDIIGQTYYLPDTKKNENKEEFLEKEIAA